MTRNLEEKVVFAISPQGQGDGIPLLVVGVPQGAWDYMKDGKTHHFDLTRVGLPIKLMLFGAENHGAAMKVLEDAAKAQGNAILDARNRDFSMKSPGGGKL